MSASTDECARRLSIPGRQRFGHAIIIVICATLIFLPSLFNGVPHGDSYHFNYSWVASFKEEWGLLNPYPRWLPQMWAGAGSPDFYFYPPLAFFASSLASSICCADPDHAISVSSWFFHLPSGFGAYRFVYRPSEILLMPRGRRPSDERNSCGADESPER